LKNSKSYQVSIKGDILTMNYNKFYIYRDTVHDGLKGKT